MNDVPLTPNFSRGHIRMNIPSVLFHFFYIDKFLAADVAGTLLGSKVSSSTDSQYKPLKINLKLPHMTYNIDLISL